MDSEDLRERLTPQQYHVTQQGGTDPAFAHPLYRNKEPGSYRCVVCGAPLFDGAAKYESGSGWPSFWRPDPEAAVEEREDRSHGMVRTEVRCGGCHAHLGHLFPDGPEPSGRRYCINGSALDFRPGG